MKMQKNPSLVLDIASDDKERNLRSRSLLSTLNPSNSKKSRFSSRSKNIISVFFSVTPLIIAYTEHQWYSGCVSASNTKGLEIESCWTQKEILVG